MKKRKACAPSQSRPSLRDSRSQSRVPSPINSIYPSRPSPHPRRRSNADLPCRPNSNNNSARKLRASSARNSTGRNAYSSLESLFPIEVEFDFDAGPLLHQPHVDKLDETGSAYTLGDPEDFINKLRPEFPELEPHLVSPSRETHGSLKLDSPNEKATPLSIEEVNLAATEELELGSKDNSTPVFVEELRFEETPVCPEIEEDNVSEKMSEHEYSNSEAGSDLPGGRDLDKLSSHRSVSSKKSSAKGGQSSKSMNESPEEENPKSCTFLVDSVYAPQAPLPPGVGAGIAVGECQRSSSIMSCLPITDSFAAEEMCRAEERANALREEIQSLRCQLQELCDKEDLKEGDTCRLKDLQTMLMDRIGELNNLTRKMQRTIGLIDPSDATFARMFDMLPENHKGVCDDDRQSSCGDQDEECTAVCQKFAFPQIDLPEDKLPRVIICGNTEENLPKIVVADSRPKSRGNPCIPTSKLTDSMCLQEKLTKEKTQLECGKFMLEQQLADKDNAVECLQRKMCGLQAEMRMMVKENFDLKQEIQCLAQKQAQQCPPPPTPKSCSPLARSQFRPTSPGGGGCGIPNKGNELACKCSVRESKPTVNSCTPRSHGLCREAGGGGGGSPRLAGGASRGGDGCCAAKSDMQRSRKSANQRSADVDCKISAYSNNTKQLSDQLYCIENEVRTLQSELCNVQRERQQLEQQRKQMESGGKSCGHCPETSKSSGYKNQDNMSCAPNDQQESSGCAAQQLRDLREQYARLQDDYKSKLCEVSRMRTDSENLKRETREAKEERDRMEIKWIDCQERLRVVESERNDLLGCKEQLVEQEQALMVARQRFREAQDELEELRSMIRDQAAQLDDYRGKYLQAQQQVEEQRRQMDLMEMDNARMNENVALEIGRVKNQFQEKLAELAPLPDILKQTQLKLQETQQLRMLAEHNCEDLSRELLSAKERIDCMQSQINDMQREIDCLQDDKSTGNTRVEELEKKNGELRCENERFKASIARLEEQQCVMQKRLDEKQHEITQLTAMLEQVREDSARQVSRTKERCEAIKRSMQAQISDFEIQLAQCRAAAKTAQKERDEIRQKMQGQIGNLNDALQQAQGRIRSLQGHVDYLKVSYSNVFGQGQESSACQPAEQSQPREGYDSCDCQY